MVIMGKEWGEWAPAEGLLVPHHAQREIEPLFRGDGQRALEELLHLKAFPELLQAVRGGDSRVRCPSMVIRGRI